MNGQTGQLDIENLSKMSDENMHPLKAVENVKIDANKDLD